jgi:hypothetical protein
MERKDYIGSSDARDILSGDWDKLYRKKIGLIPDADLSDSFPVQLGLLTEDFHIDWSVRALNAEGGPQFKWSKTAKDGEQHCATFTPEGSFNAPLLGSHPDALLRDELANVYPLEAKITGRFKNADEASDFYMPQLQHHMLCMGTDLILFSAVIGTTAPERIWVGASPEWQEHYIAKCDTFWGHVKSEIPPAPVFYDKVKKAAPIVPAKVADSVPRDGFKKRSLDGDNRAPELIEAFFTDQDAEKRFKSTKETLKSLMREDENELYSDRLTLKRDVRGAIRFYPKKEAA